MFSQNVPNSCYHCIREFAIFCLARSSVIVWPFTIASKGELLEGIATKLNVRHVFSEGRHGRLRHTVDVVVVALMVVE